MKGILHWLFVFVLVVHSWAQNPDSIQDQMEKNRVDMGAGVLSPDGYWKLSMIRETEGGPYALVVSHGDFQKKVTESSKPDNRVCWSSDLRYMVIVKPVGFCTMVDVFHLDRERNQITEVFSSEKENRRQFVDYLFQRWDMERGTAVFDVRESPRYLEGRKPRLFATEYIYLDGENGFGLKE